MNNIKFIKCENKEELRNLYNEQADIVSEISFYENYTPTSTGDYAIKENALNRIDESGNNILKRMKKYHAQAKMFNNFIHDQYIKIHVNKTPLNESSKLGNITPTNYQRTLKKLYMLIELGWINIQDIQEDPTINSSIKKAEYKKTLVDFLDYDTSLENFEDILTSLAISSKERQALEIDLMKIFSRIPQDVNLNIDISKNVKGVLEEIILKLKGLINEV